MITTETVFVAQCDGCKTIWDNGDGVAGYFDINHTKEGIMNSEWHTTDDEKTYCPKCWTMDEEDNIIIKNHDN